MRAAGPLGRYMFDFIRKFHTIFQSSCIVSQSSLSGPTTFPRLGVGSCVGFLLLHNKSSQMQHLKAAYLYELIFPRPGVMHDSVRFSAQHRARLKTNVEVLGQNHFRPHSSCWLSSVSYSCRMKSPFLNWLSPRATLCS